MAKPERPGAVIFDWNGTLSDMGVLAAQDIALAAQFGRHLDAESIRRLWGQPAETFYAQLVPDSGLSWQELRRRFRELDPQFPKRLQPHVVSTLGHLAEYGVRMAVVTSAPREVVQGTYMVEAGLPQKYFDFMHFDAEVSAARAQGLPDMAPAVAAFTEQGIAPENIVLVGDEPNDLRNARAAGIGFVAVANGTKLPTELRDAGIPQSQMIPDLSYLPGALKLGQ